jgi:hypothetical protein
MRCNSAPYKRRATCSQGVLTKELCKIADAAAEIFFFICLLAERRLYLPNKSWPRARPVASGTRSHRFTLKTGKRAACVWAYAARMHCKFVGPRALSCIIYVSCCCERERCSVKTACGDANKARVAELKSLWAVTPLNGTWQMRFENSRRRQSRHFQIASYIATIFNLRAKVWRQCYF